MLQETTTSRMKPAIALEGISKSFPGVRALSDVSLSLYPGSVTALIGENGAGKSTLVKILTGIYQPDGGAIRVDGRRNPFPDRAFGGPCRRHRDPSGNRAVRRTFGRRKHLPRPCAAQPFRPDRLEEAERRCARTAATASARKSIRRSGCAISALPTSIWWRSPALLSIDARVVIMDEPTAALSHKEIHELYELIDRLKADGKAILFISHKFDEIFRIADRYTVFRDGGMVGEGLIADVTQDQLVKMMVGRDVGQVFPKVEVAIGATCADRLRLSPSDRIRGYQFRASPRRDPRLLRPDRCWPLRVHAVADRHHPALGRCRQAGRRGPRHPLARPKRSKPASSMCRRNAAARARSSACRSSRTSRCPRCTRTSRSGFLKLAKEFALAREYTAAARSARRIARSGRRHACRAATSRRWSSPSGWRPSRR